MKKLTVYLLATILVVLLFSFCNNKNKKLNHVMTNETYEAEWKEITELDNKGLPKSALEKVDELYKKVIKKNDQPQIVKCLIYKSKYMVALEEDGFVKAIAKMQSDMESASYPTKQIFQSMLGEQYSNYLQRNYWRIQNRTETVDFKTDDIQTWTTGQLTEESKKFYLLSVADKRIKDVDIKNWKVIMTEAQESDHLRPSLYDFLAHRALDFLRNESNYVSEPAYKFYIEDEAAFANPKTFASHTFETKDEISKKYQTVKLFQEIIAVHLSDSQPDALIVADLKRLKFMKENAVMDGKEELYLKALEELENKYKESGASTEVLYEIAQYHFQKGHSYNPNPDDNGKLDYKKAFDICEKAIQRLTDSHGAKLCKNLQSKILQKDLRVEMEKVNIPNTPMLALVRHKNVSKLKIKVVRISEKARNELAQTQYDRIVTFLNNQETVKEWSMNLPQEGDYRKHSVEIKVDALPSGSYAILATDDEVNTKTKYAVSYALTEVSNISYWTRRNEVNETEFFVVNRTTGVPLENVKVEFYNRNYNSQSRKYDYTIGLSEFTDKDGYLKPNIGESRNFQAKFINGKDVLWLDDNFSNYRYRNNEEAYQRTEFFTDRAIYRPGQTIYFKAMVLNYDKDRMPTIIPNRKVAITFRDANRQEVKQLEMVTNEYGTVNGSFVAPKSGLLGRMSIRSSISGSHSVRVEEYKRPKFEVKFDPVDKSYKIDEEVTVTGKAKAFAGSNVDGAKVTYRVVRETIYPYWRYWRGYYPQGNSQEITNGETTTDANGNYNITFTALPDKTVDKKTKPQFNYQVYVDVVDITGETHSEQTSVSVGYIALNVSVDVPSQSDKSDLAKKELKITSTNLNGEFQEAAGTIKVHALKNPTQTFRKRYWGKPDQYVMTKEEFQKDFPYDSFKEEDKIENWEVGKEVFSMDFDTKNKRKNFLPSSSWEIGGYVLTLNTQDKDGEKIELKKYFTLYDISNKKIPKNLVQLHFLEKNKYEPGEVAKSIVGSGFDNIKVLYEVEFDGKITDRNWLNINDLTENRINILEKHRGNIGYYLTYVKNNRIYNLQQQIIVPWSNKDLKFEYATFRDKLLPGQDEEWRIKISGNKKDRVAAELVAAMYDASLDQFVNHNWYLNLFPTRYLRQGIRTTNFSITQSQLVAKGWQPESISVRRLYRRLNWFGFSMYGNGIRMEKNARVLSSPASSRTTDSAMKKEAEPMMAEMAMADEVELVEADMGNVLGGNSGNSKSEEEQDISNVKVRTNLNETVFFFPEIKTDANGDVILKFKMNESLTRWKFLGLAHTKDLKFGLTEKEIVTQKELMVLPNAPRFMREGDEIEFTAKVSNLTKEVMTGNAVLELYDALSMQSVDALLGNDNKTITFTAEAGQSARLAWKLKIPEGQVMALTHRVIAQAGKYSDGEESTLPIITNRMLVTETMPLPVRGNQTKDFSFTRLSSVNSSTLRHHKMTLEFTSNPAWYAVQALPYMMEYPYDCTEQIFSRYYANSLASNVANSHPKVKQIFESWKGTDAMKSNLSKNQELKSALLEETPWVLAAQSEEEQKRNIGLLFDLNRMSEERAEAVNKISERQLNNGGFSWFPGGRDSWYITQYLVEGFGHLEALGVNDRQADPKVAKMINGAVNFIDARIAEYYEKISRRVKDGKTKWEDDHLDYMAIHYLYARSFYKEFQMDGNPKKAHDYFLGQAEKYWLNKNMYAQGMLALALHRNGKQAFTKEMIASFKERSLNNEELGMYWKYDRGYYWYQLPIETHALMIEVFDEVANDEVAVDDLKVWLLKAKQTTNWKTTKATAAAVYALLRRGANWLLEDKPVQITVGNKKIDQSKMNVEAGTGYFKTSWDGEEIDSNMGNVKVQNPNATVAWGAMYWQYFEQLDKITTFEETPLKLNKKLFKKENSDRGPVMTELKEGSKLEPGDKIQVRIELQVDRPMEYVHMKDMRASGFEPTNVLSQYKWQGGLGYYESTKDASTNFFISYLPKGTFVFEYPMVVNHKGDFSNGITTIQCMYAPEFTSHSEGIRVTVE